MWVVWLLGIGALVVVGVVGVNLVSSAVDPCPAGYPTIPPPGQLLVVINVLLDECVSVSGRWCRTTSASWCWRGESTSSALGSADRRMS